MESPRCSCTCGVFRTDLLPTQLAFQRNNLFPSKIAPSPRKQGKLVQVTRIPSNSIIYYISNIYHIYNIYTHCKYMLLQIVLHGMTGALLEDMLPLGSQGDRLEVVMLLPRLSRGVIIHSQKDYTSFKVSLRGGLLTCDFFKRSQSIAYIIYISCIYMYIYIYVYIHTVHIGS